MRHALLALVVALLVSACTSRPHGSAQLSEEDRIREAVFRYQFEFNASGLGSAANAYFLSVEGGSDPSPQLLQQFDDHHPPVKPVSDSVLEAGTAQVLDRESGLPGLIFAIAEIRRLGDDSVEVEGGYEEASESGSVNVYHLERKSGRWEVVGDEMLLIK